MIISVKVTNHIGESITLTLRNPEQSGFFIEEIMGLGPINADINITEVLSLDGGKFNSARLKPRNVVFHIGFLDISESIETLRQQSYKYFPLKKLVNLEITTDNRVCSTSGYVEKNEPDIFSKSETAQVSIICPNPYLDSTTFSEFTVSPTEALFEFPFENASLTEPLLEFSNIDLTPTLLVSNSSDIEVGALFIIDAIGGIISPSFLNTLNGEYLTIDSDILMSIAGEDIKYGDYIVISTVKGNKYATLVRNGTSINILNAITQDSSWIQLDLGSNLFEISAISGVMNAVYSISYIKAYQGI